MIDPRAADNALVESDMLKRVTEVVKVKAYYLCLANASGGIFRDYEAKLTRTDTQQLSEYHPLSYTWTPRVQRIIRQRVSLANLVTFIPSYLSRCLII